MTATNFYLTKLSVDDLQRLLDVLPSVGNVSLDLGDALLRQLQRESQRRVRVADNVSPPWEPEPLTIEHRTWTDQQAAEALDAAGLLAGWARVESEPIGRFADWVLLLCITVVNRRFLHRCEDFEAVSRDLRVEIASAAEPPVCFAIAD